MIKQKTLIILLITAGTLLGQQIGVWKNYTDMKTIIQSAVASDGIWNATEGGAFYYSPDEDFVKLTKSDGLSSHDLTSVAIDNTGKIWFGTQEGIINVYDPSTSTIKKILDIYNSDKSQKRINSLFITGDTAFVSTVFGLSLINTNNYSFYETIVKFGDFSAETSVNSSWKSLLVYVCTSKGIAVQKQGATNLTAPEAWTNYSLDASTAYKIVQLDNSLYASTDNGIYKFNGTNWEQLLLASEDIVDINLQGNTLYILLRNTLYSYSNSLLTSIYENNSVQFYGLQFNQGTIYISTDDGLLKTTGAAAELVYPNSPMSNSFQSLAIDQESNVWVGSGRDEFGVGIFKYDGTEWTNYNMSNTAEFGSNAFHEVYVAPDSTKYFCSWGNGFTTLRNNVIETFNASNTSLRGVPWDPNFIVVRNVMNDSKNNTWVLNYLSAERHPLSVLTNTGQWYHYEFDDPLISENTTVEKLVIDQYDTKWFAVTEGNLGLYYFNENSTFGSTNNDRIGYINASYFESDLITALAVDNRGEIWVGTNKGLNIIQNTDNPTSQITKSYGLAQQTINAIVVDPLNQKWVGTNQGLFMMSQDGIQILEHYNTTNCPLPTNQITSLAIDENTGILYIGSDYGMTSLTTDAIQPEESFSELFVYPNPLIIGNGTDVRLTIDGLISDSNIKILSIDGNLISEFVTSGGRMTMWDGKDTNGKYVPSGIYIIVAYDEEANNVAKAKLAVLRK